MFFYQPAGESIRLILLCFAILKKVLTEVHAMAGSATLLSLIQAHCVRAVTLALSHYLPPKVQQVFSWHLM